MRSLVKGYGDTHERGQAKFDKLVGFVPSLLGQSNSSATLEVLIKAALADEGDEALDKAIADLGPASSTTSLPPIGSAHSSGARRPDARS
jgi:indolepyruvate ferredoxin oxidoreductase, beta subunit